MNSKRWKMQKATSKNRFYVREIVWEHFKVLQNFIELQEIFFFIYWNVELIYGKNKCGLKYSKKYF